jgi:HAD superfamily hydrolase (TIGR01509 family)
MSWTFADFEARLQLHDRFDHCFFSNEMGRGKPDRDCYDFVIQRTQVLPQEIAFFDDNPDCVAGAIGAGMVARRCDGVGGLRLALSGLGIPSI